MMLGPRERCPIHKNLTCMCHRAGVAFHGFPHKSKWEQVRPGVRRIKDEHADHPDGYRYRLSTSEKRKVILRKIAEKNECGICHQPFETLSGIVADHERPKGLGGARSDDRPENLRPAHSICNLEKGSKRIA